MLYSIEIIKGVDYVLENTLQNYFAKKIKKFRFIENSVTRLHRYKHANI